MIGKKNQVLDKWVNSIFVVFYLEFLVVCLWDTREFVQVVAGRQTIDQLNIKEGINFWKDDVMYGLQNAIHQKLANSIMFLTAMSCIWKKER